MTAAPMPASAFWVPEIWFEPRIRDCLRDDSATVLYVVLQSRRPITIDAVVLDLFHIELRDADGRTYVRAMRFDVEPMAAQSTVDLVRSLEPAAGAAAVHDVMVVGCLRGRDAETGEHVVEPVAFCCDVEDDIYLRLAPGNLALHHAGWATAAGR